MELHEQIRKEREKQGFSKYKIARMMDMSESYYGEIEAGKKPISRKTIEKLCDALKVSVTLFPGFKTTVKPHKK